jgi:hypothetical protein
VLGPNGRRGLGRNEGKNSKLDFKFLEAKMEAFKMNLNLNLVLELSQR